jgi:protein arginine N-methyltransferase 1
MLADTERINWFQQAIEAAVRPDDVVVDLGCGLGTFAMQASRAGARRVFAVEMDEVINVAEKIAQINDCDIEFLSGDAKDVELPEPVSLLIFEDYGTGLLDDYGGKLLEMAREKWVGKNYRVLPQGASLYVAPISSDSIRKEVFPFGPSSDSVYGFDFGPINDIACNSVIQTRGETDVKIIADPTCVLDQDFMQPLPMQWSTEVSFKIAADSPFDGISLWHDLHLNDEITYSNHPSNFAIWGQFFFPAPIRWDMKSDDELKIEIAFLDGYWKWNLKQIRQGELIEQCSGNTFASSSLTVQQLEKLSDSTTTDKESDQKSQLLPIHSGNKSGSACDQRLSENGKIRQAI